jgi:uncharacterized small protein (DUF1192 family)
VTPDDDRLKKKVTHELGQDLHLLSVGELDERIVLLASEIERLKTARANKEAAKAAAASFFKS